MAYENAYKILWLEKCEGSVNQSVLVYGGHLCAWRWCHQVVVRGGNNDVFHTLPAQPYNAAPPIPIPIITNNTH